jgi:hypothetical protein
MFQPAALLYPALLGVVWHLTDGLNRFACVFDGVSHCERLGPPYELVRWEYGIEWDQAAGPLRDHGFVLAKSHRTRPEFSTGRVAEYRTVRRSCSDPSLDLAGADVGDPGRRRGEHTLSVRHRAR